MRCFNPFFSLAVCVALTPAVTVLARPGSSGCRNWHLVLRDLQRTLFEDGHCNDSVRQSVRITFHDAIGYSTAMWTSGKNGGGGADGSLIKFAETELACPANKGLQGIVDSLKRIADTHNVSYGDIIQFAGAIGLSNCPGAPRLAFFAGRPQATAPAPSNLFPAPMDTASTILARMQDAGFSAEETVALLGAHSMGKQRTIDSGISGKPLDSTPGVFDSQFYLEMLLKGTAYPGRTAHLGETLSPSKDIFRFSSDSAIARHPRTACAWQSYIGEDERLRTAFRQAMLKVSTLGQKMHELTDCSDVIPEPPSSNRTTRYPAGLGPANIEQSVRFCVSSICVL
ncbi:heme peroxidase [Daedaleopsis nitida]|nr:heme peroxidase [Daedaleopsis nitida]